MNPEQLQHIEQQLAAVTDPQLRLQHMLQLLTFYDDNDFVKCWVMADEANELAQLTNDRYAIAKSNEHAASALWKLAEHTKSIHRYEMALDNYLSIGHLHGAARCYCGIGIVCGSLEDYRMALDYFEEGLSAARRAGKDELAATIIGNIGHVYFKFGHYREAMDCFQRAFEFQEGNENYHAMANMLGGQAGVHVYRAEYERGLDLIEKAIKFNRQVKHLRGEAVLLMNRGITLQKMGRHKAARTQLHEALDFCKGIKLHTVEYEVYKNLHHLYQAMGQEAEAEECLKKYMEGQKEEKREAVKRRTEQFRQRQLLKGESLD